jgi:hypothetical protein
VVRTPARRVARFEYLSDGAGPGDPQANFGWRVLAANNRPLGRTVAITQSLADSRESALAIHHRVLDATTVIAPESARDVWVWRVSLDSVAVAVCVRPYLRRVECLRGVGQFLTAVRDASPEDGVLRHFGPRSLRSFVVDLRPTGVTT